MTPDRLLLWLIAFPYPGAVAMMQGDELTIALEGEVLRFDGAWLAPDGQKIPCTLPDDCDAGDVHAEVERGLAIARGITSASWHKVKPESVEPPAPADEPIVIGGGPTVDILRTAIESIAEHVGAEPWALDEVKSKVASMQDRLTDEIDRRKDVEAQLAEMTDAHAVVSQRLVGAQREVADLEQQRDALADAGAALSEIASLCGVSLPATAAQTVEAVSALLAERDGLKGRLRGAEGSLKSIRRALDDCNAPRHYLDDDGREAAEVSAADRVRILAEIARAERALREQVERNAAVSRDHLSGVARALDDTGAPRQAGAVTLSPAARVRAIGVVK